MKFLKLISSILPPLFWGLIIFGFEEPYLAVTSLICAMIHELGHLLLTPCEVKMRGVVSGFRIAPRGILSYRERLLSYLGGPMANIIFALLCLFPTSLGKGYLQVFAVLNLATAVSNLLPIEGYDGYGIILTVLEAKEANSRSYAILSWVSRAIIMTTCIFSLCLIDRVNGGYWIFAIFFSHTLKVIHRDISKVK
jgi:Zn-dependent protease